MTITIPVTVMYNGLTVDYDVTVTYSTPTWEPTLQRVDYSLDIDAVEPAGSGIDLKPHLDTKVVTEIESAAAAFIERDPSPGHEEASR